MKARTTGPRPLQPRRPCKQVGEPAPHDVTTHRVFRAQCSACPGFRYTHTAPLSFEEEHPALVDWWVWVIDEFVEHYIDHPGRVAPCGGTRETTRDGDSYEPPQAVGAKILGRGV
jgi:hypothetical protein